MVAEPRWLSSVEAEITETGKSFIALARWLSALVVFCAHLRAIMFVGWVDLPSEARTIPVFIFYTATSFFHEAVIVFFVLSGFLVGGVNYRRAAERKFQPASYAIDRFTRIYVTLVPAILLTLAVDYLGRHFIGFTGFYDGSNPLIMERFHAAIQDHDSLRTAVANLAMLQPVYVPVLGSNFPLWSLSYEVWFYTWFVLLAIPTKARTTTSFLLLIVSTGIFAFLFQLVALYYLAIWCFGLLALAYRRWPQWLPGPIIALFASLGLAASYVTQTSIFGVSVRLSDLAVGLSFAWLISVLKERNIPVLMRMRRVNHRLSDVSYSLYVIHFPMMLLVCGVLAGLLGLETQLPRGLLPTDWRAICLYVGIVGCVLVFVFAFAGLFERRTGDVRRFVKKALLDRVGAI